MSSFQSSFAGAQEIAVKIANSTVTDIVDGSDGGWNIPWMSVGCSHAATPNVTVELYDVANTTSFYLVADGYCWNARAMPEEKFGISFDDVVVPKGWKIRVTSSDSSGRLDVTGIKVSRTS